MHFFDAYDLLVQPTGDKLAWRKPQVHDKARKLHLKPLDKTSHIRLREKGRPIHLFANAPSNND
jgi:hypothetical protein